MLRFAVRNLLSRPARTLLSLLGLTVAIVGMVGLFSVAAGIDAMVADTFGRIPGLLVMQRGAPIPLFSRVPKAWAEEVAALPGVNAVSAEIWVRVNTINRKNIVSPPRFLFGADVVAHQKLNYSVYGSAIQQGRYLTEADIGQPRAVISRSIATEFRVGPGDSLTVNGATFEIVGIYHCGSLLLDTAIIVEQSLVRRMSLFDPGTVCSFYVEPTGEIPSDRLAEQIRELFRGRELGSWQPASLLSGLLGGGGGGRGGAGADRAGAEPVSPSGNPLIDLIRGANRSLRNIGPGLTPPAAPDPAGAGDDAPSTAVSANAQTENSAVDSGSVEAARPAAAADDGTSLEDGGGGDSDEESDEDNPVEVRSAADWAERFDEFSADLDIFLTIMTSIGLTIAVLSIVNTMLMSVSERIIEFGILKANGWSRGDVMKLITFESAVLGFAGGLTGCGAGWLLTRFINWNWPDQVHLAATPGLLLSSLALATALGVLGGLYPAVWATRMMPMDAIRRG